MHDILTGVYAFLWYVQVSTMEKVCAVVALGYPMLGINGLRGVGIARILCKYTATNIYCYKYTVVQTTLTYIAKICDHTILLVRKRSFKVTVYCVINCSSHSRNILILINIANVLCFVFMFLEYLFLNFCIALFFMWITYPRIKQLRHSCVNPSHTIVC